MSKEISPVLQTCQALATMEGKLAAALPKNIPSERFLRIAQMAVQNEIVAKAINGGADKSSLYNAVSKCAQDGLVLDGREAALVPFKGMIQYMPMVAGIIKKAYNSGEILSISAHVVYEKDFFSYELGDNEHIKHIPSDESNPGELVRVYAIGKLKGGGIQRVVMNKAQIEKHKKIAKTDFMWKAWPEEMWEKTAVKKLAKRLPQSSELDRLFQQDNELIDVNQAQETETTTVTEKPVVKNKAAEKLKAAAGIIPSESQSTVSKNKADDQPPLTSYNNSPIEEGEFMEIGDQQEGDAI